MAPSSFLTNLKELGLDSEVGEVVFHKVCQQLELLAEQNFYGAISVNVFARHFKNGQLPNFIGSLLSIYNIKPEQLVLEISESVLMDDPGFAFACLNGLKALGVGIILDDFATGDIALQILRRLPFDEIKIDRQFIRNIGHDNKQFQFVKTLINLAKGFDKQVCIEGIEDDHQLSLLQATDADYLQGYLMGQPMLAAKLDDFMSKQQAIQQIFK
jgi:EAL domain-containing protein (putative c-di-GMP-specific phosphodiesterase class I)